MLFAKTAVCVYSMTPYCHNSFMVTIDKLLWNTIVLVTSIWIAYWRKGGDEKVFVPEDKFTIQWKSTFLHQPLTDKSIKQHMPEKSRWFVAQRRTEIYEAMGSDWVLGCRCCMHPISLNPSQLLGNWVSPPPHPHLWQLPPTFPLSTESQSILVYHPLTPFIVLLEPFKKKIDEYASEKWTLLVFNWLLFWHETLI